MMENRTSSFPLFDEVQLGGLPSWYKLTERLTCGLAFTLGCPASLLIIYLVRKVRKLRNATFYFIASLAVADFMVLFMMVIYMLDVDVFKTRMQERVRMFLYPSTDMFLAAASMVNVACVSVDRAIAVAFPLQYDHLVTSEKSKYVLVAVWVYSVLVLVASCLRMATSDWSYDTSLIYTCFTLSYFVPMALILLSYGAIVFFAVRGLKFTKFWELKAFDTKVRADGEKGSGNTKRPRRKLLRELKVTLNILVLVVPFTLGWTFFIGTHIYEESRGHGYVIEDYTLNVIIEITPWIISGLNPILYFMLTRSIRQGFFSLVRKKMSIRSYRSTETHAWVAVMFSCRAQVQILGRCCGEDRKSKRSREKHDHAGPSSCSHMKHLELANRMGHLHDNQRLTT